MAYNVVTNYTIITEIKKCTYFKTNLGLAATVDKGGNRVFRENDQFSYNYNKTYNTTLLGQGNVGDIKFYTDHLIRESVLVVYIGSNYEEFIINVDFKEIKEKGIDNFLGGVIKEVEIQFEERNKLRTEEKIEEKKQVGNPDLIFKNPGSVSYNDIKEYLDQQNKNRYKV
jgi:hypothetical protein